MTGSVKWSYTTVGNLRQCARKFYFASVLASFGRKDALRRKAYELKHMQNLKMWAGSVVDKFIEVTVIPMIVRKDSMNFAELADQAVKLAEEQFRFSKNAGYTDATQKKGDIDSQFCILDIHEVNATYTEAELQEAYNNIRQGILNFPDTNMPDGTRLIDFLTACKSLTPNVNNWQVDIEKARLKPQIDLLALNKDYKPVVIDWKLSSSFTSDYSRQLIICGITVYLKRLEKTEKPPYKYADISLYEVNLQKRVVREHTFSEAKAHELINYINLTADDIFQMTGNDNSQKTIDDFEMTDDAVLCQSCNFQGLCSFLELNQKHYDEKSYYQSVQAK